MTTRWLTRKPVADASVALVSLGASSHLLESLRAKGIGKVHVTDDPRQIISLARGGEVDLIVLALEGAVAADTDLQLIRTLREGSSPPVLIVTSSFEGLRRDLERRLPVGCRPEQMLTGAVPVARLLHVIDEQLMRRCLAKVPEQLDDSQPSFAELFTELWRERRSGELRVMREGVQTIVYLRDGAPIFAEQGSRSDLLGLFLVETGKITEEQLGKAIEILTNQLVENEQLQLGGVLINMGLLTVDELYLTLAAQVRRKVARCFGAGRYFAEFREGAEHVELVTAFELAMPEVLMSGVQETSLDEVERFLGPHTLHYPRLNEPAKAIQASYQLGGREAHFLDEIDGRTSVAELRLTSTIGPEQAGRTLMALGLGGAVRFDAAAAAGPTRPAPPVKEPRPNAAQAVYGSARKPDAPEEEERSWGRIKSIVDRARKKPSDR